METKFNFNSQICTDRVQSERLLALGLKKETADCLHTHCWSPEDGITNDIPAWSLHRLLDMAVESPHEYFTIFIPAAYNDIISHIEWLIKEGYFNKEYLEE